jgi:hypothetical protein
MFWDVKTVKPLPNYRICVQIEDGRKGTFDLKPYLNHGVLRELRDVHYFTLRLTPQSHRAPEKFAGYGISPIIAWVGKGLATISEVTRTPIMPSEF